jgi:serine/threonine protein kinase
MAPETAVGSYAPSSDLYSLGVLIYAIHANGGKPFNSFGKDLVSFKRYCDQLKQGKTPNLTCIPDGLRESVRMLLNIAPEMRPGKSVLQ